MKTTTTNEPQQPPAVACSDGLGCSCWSETNARLKEKGYKLSDACSMLKVTDDLGLHATRGIPLEKADGSKPKRTDARMLEVSYCCFCGKKYPDEEAS